MKENINTNFLVLKTHTKSEVKKLIKVREIKDKTVDIIMEKQTSMSSFGVIGPIHCPSDKDEKERKMRK